MVRFESETGMYEYWYSIQYVVKTLNLKHEGKSLGRNKFIEMLRYNGYIMKDSNMPTQRVITLGVMRYHMVTRRYRRYGMPLFSDAGLDYIKRRIANGDIQMGFQKKVKKNITTVKLQDVC